MLPTVLLHMVTAAGSVYNTANRGSHGNRFRSAMENPPSIFVVLYSNNRNFLLICKHEPPGIMHLSTTRGIESCSIQHQSVLSFMLQGFNHRSIEFIEKRIVIVETIGHRVRDGNLINC